MESDKIKKAIWGAIFIVLLLPPVQYALDIIQSMPLYGAYVPSPDVEFSAGAWWSGEYQEKKSMYLNDNVGFRSDFVRLSNQVDFSLFRKLHSETVLGKDGYLFQQPYMNAMQGKDFFGYDSIKRTVERMRYIRDVFRKANKTFLLIHAPSKAACYVDKLPYDPRDRKEGATNYEVYKRYCDSFDVPQMDLSGLFTDLVKKGNEHLFTRQGVHWSVYGAMYAVDTIIKFIEHDRDIRLPHPDWSETITTTEARAPDNDLGWMLNLIWPIRETFVYPVIRFPEDTAGEKPSAVYVGDSFMWPLIADSLMTHTHSEWEFWYYFNRVINKDYNGVMGDQKLVSEYGWGERLDAVDCVIMLYAAHNLNEMSRFVEGMYTFYKSKEKATQ